MRKTKVLKKIESMYQDQRLDFLPTYDRAKTLLEVYRNVVWSLKNSAEYIVSESTTSYGKDLDTALIYLSSFVSEKKRQDFESKVTHLFESRWLIGLVDRALEKIYDYPEYGKTYYTILKHCYLNEKKSRDEVVMHLIRLERSSYYQRKREAISLLGVSLWGFELPKVLNELHELGEEAVDLTVKKVRLPIYSEKQIKLLVSEDAL